MYICIYMVNGGLYVHLKWTIWWHDYIFMISTTGQAVTVIEICSTGSLCITWSLLIVPRTSSAVMNTLSGWLLMAIANDKHLENCALMKLRCYKRGKIRWAKLLCLSRFSELDGASQLGKALEIILWFINLMMTGWFNNVWCEFSCYPSLYPVRK